MTYSLRYSIVLVTIAATFGCGRSAQHGADAPVEHEAVDAPADMSFLTHDGGAAGAASDAGGDAPAVDAQDAASADSDDAAHAGDATGGDEAGSDGPDARLPGFDAGDGGVPWAPDVCAASFAPPKAPAAADATATVQAQVEAQELAELDSLFGRLLRGEVLVYRGTFSGEAVDGAYESPAPHTKTTEVPSGRALAMLGERAPRHTDWFPAQPPLESAPQEAFLVVHALDAPAYGVFAQVSSEPSRTWATSLPIDAVTGFPIAPLDRSCVSCAPLFATRPATLALSGLDATGMATTFQGLGNYVDVATSTKATASLQVAPACTLTWDDFTVLDRIVGPYELASDIGLQAFTAVGDEMVAHRHAIFGMPQNPGECAFTTEYTIDLFVKKADPTAYGTRNYHGNPPVMMCRPLV
jgi:hypothetical protein